MKIIIMPCYMYCRKWLMAQDEVESSCVSFPFHLFTRGMRSFAFPFCQRQRHSPQNSEVMRSFVNVTGLLMPFSNINLIGLGIQLEFLFICCYGTRTGCCLVVLIADQCSHTISYIYWYHQQMTEFICLVLKVGFFACPGGEKKHKDCSRSHSGPQMDSSILSLSLCCKLLLSSKPMFRILGVK